MNIKIIFLLFLYIGYLHIHYSAQNIRGFIQAEDGSPIADANVYLLNTNIGTLSNEDGSYSLSARAGTYQLSVSVIGFASQLKEIKLSVDPINEDFILLKDVKSLDQIVVTGQRSEESIIQAPLSISFLSAEKVAATRTWDLSSLNGVVPNYNNQERGVGFQQIQAIRGIQVFSENPAVVTLIDGVNALDILANGIQLLDIEKIEVLRGPQGTLFGRNAMGGVVNIQTKQPTNRTSAFAELSGGNLNMQRYALGVQMPLVKDQLFVGLNGLYHSENGFLTNDTSLAQTPFPDPSAQGARVGDEESYYGNFYLKWLPSAQFRATLNVKAQIDQSDASNYFVGVEDDALALIEPDFIYLSRVGEHRRSVINTALSLHYYAPALTLSSITTYQRIGLSFKDIDSGGIFSSYDSGEIGGTPDPQEVYTQELKISSANPQKRLQYTAGVYGFAQDALEPTTNLALEQGPNTFAIFRNIANNFGLAVFGQAAYRFSPKWDLTAGLRFDYEDRESTFNGFGDLVDQDGVLTEIRADTTISGDYHALSPKVALSYQLSDKARAYVSYTRGFRAGGINAQRLPDGADQTFDPEYSDNFELGVKTQAFQQTLFIAATAFYINWTHLQFFNLVGPFTFSRENVGDAVSYGLELEASWLAVNNLQIDASLGLNETEYDDFTLTRINPLTFEEVVSEIGGNRLSNAPQRTAFLAAQYTIPLAKELQLVLRGEFRNIGSYFTDIQNDLEQASYSLISTRSGIQYKFLELYFWGQNLTDQRFIVYGSPDTGFNRFTRVSAPRMYGGTLSIRL